ncbi:hypothetical protein Psesu_0417 [Pseudoxanthomonas suwonensis 11-1]|uniref:Lipoprotein n=1 Tax=Pseudoxanthomonas suwonensis (strain 11-1) TaxID=743721 RepID=E6WQ27_PSEUU|nr:hypothetical protein [Pseudoxanthomonas suwonensis]ADV26276.1 hypothetical protein Psesu_0417 [Pseudoxanthomonas suwonensis 11-1]
MSILPPGPVLQRVGLLLVLPAALAGCDATPSAPAMAGPAGAPLAEAMEASWGRLDEASRQATSAPCDTAAAISLALDGWVNGVEAAGLRSRFATQAAIARHRAQSIQQRCTDATAPATAAAPVRQAPSADAPRPALSDAVIDAYVRGMDEEIALMRASGNHFVSLSAHDAQGRQVAAAAGLAPADYRRVRDALQKLLYEDMLHARYAGTEGQARLSRLERHKRDHALEVLARDPYAPLSADERETVQARMAALRPLYTRYMELATVGD